MIDVLKMEIEGNEFFLITYVVDESMVGCVQMDEVNTPSANIFRLYVAPNARYKGVGSQLIRECLSLARENNCKSAALTIAKNNREVIPFYEKLGFIFAMEWPDSGLQLFVHTLGDE